VVKAVFQRSLRFTAAPSLAFFGCIRLSEIPGHVTTLIHRGFGARTLDQSTHPLVTSVTMLTLLHRWQHILCTKVHGLTCVVLLPCLPSTALAVAMC
jgi:hypothetical protein